MVEAPPLLAWLETQIDADEQRAVAMRDAVWPSEVWVAAAEDTGGIREDGITARVTVGPQWSPKAYSRMWYPGWPTPLDYTDSPHDAEVMVWSPSAAARALAECAAKRRVLTRHAPQQVVQHAGVRVCRCCAHIWPCPDVLDIAVVYQDRDGWYDGWAPRG